MWDRLSQEEEFVYVEGVELDMTWIEIDTLGSRVSKLKCFKP